jgi:RNA polymerase sigma factor (sigma-70 family)
VPPDSRNAQVGLCPFLRILWLRISALHASIRREAHAVTSETSLLQRIARGDATAVQEFLDAYGGLVWSIVRQRVSAEEADDVVQEVFIAAWKSADRFDPERASEAAFVTTIARRRLIDHQRREGRRLDDGELETALPVLQEDSEDLQAIDLKDEARVAATVLEELRPEQGRVLRMAIVEGQTHTQIAVDLDMPVGTVKTHVRRGLVRVRELLAARGWDTIEEERE